MKFAKIIAAALFCVTALAATPLDEVNQAIASMLVDYNYPGSEVKMVVSAAETTAQRATEFSGYVSVDKMGEAAAGKLGLTFVYQYPDAAGSEPRFAVAGALDSTDLTTIFANLGVDRQMLNEMFEGAQDMLREMANELLKEYGSAATAQVTVSNLTKDANGDYQTVDVELGALIDLSQLPAGMPVENVWMTACKVVFKMDLSKGMMVEFAAKPNPLHSSFKEDQQGLKEYVDSLLQKDTDTLSGILELVSAGNMLMEMAIGNTVALGTQANSFLSK